MDPNATLKLAQEKAMAILTNLDTDGPVADLIQDAEMLAQAVQDLDGWISRGGFLPGDWSKSAVVT